MVIAFIFSILMNMSPLLIFDFNPNTKLNTWYVVDDVVMGGRSSGNLLLDENGFGIFTGHVSLENNGGFSSIRHRFKKLNIENYNTIAIKLKGDGNKYQFRIKSDSNDYYSYVAEFKTYKHWETIYIPLNTMQPRFRGKTLDLPHFQENFIEEISFLIANKVSQDFELIIDKIELIQKDSH